jgi:hypothetical protein
MTEPQPVVTRDFDTDGPVDMTLTIGAGVVDVRLTDEPGITVTVRHAPDSASPWVDSISSIVTWFSGEQTSADAPTEAVRQTKIEFGAGRLVVRSPQSAQLRGIPVAVTVRAPAGSNITTRSGAATVTVAGAAGRVEAATAGGSIDVEEAKGAHLTTGSGSIKVGKATAEFRARTGSGEVEAADIVGPSTVFTGRGAVWLGAVAGDLMVRTGTGNVTVADASAGQIELTTGSGDLRIAVHAGSAAEVDLSSGSGEARSELPLSSNRPTTSPALRIRARTGSGTALITQSTP